MELNNNKENHSGNVTKKQKTHNKPPNGKVIRKPKTPLVERCLICKQYNSDILNYSGHPNGAVDEFIALTDEKLLLFRGDESIVIKEDQRPVNKVTSFSVYDTNGHLCPFDTGLISDNKLLFFSGYIKAVYEEDSSPKNGIATKDMGPINEWYIAGFNGGEKPIVGFSTQYGEYYLLEPSNEYKGLMQPVLEKITLTKLIIEFLLDKVQNSHTFEDLLQDLNRTGTQYFNEETVLRHAQFICDQVDNFDTTADISLDEVPLMNTPCMLTLTQMSGLSCQELKLKLRTIPVVNHTSIRTHYKQQKSVFTKATSTRLVREVFESFFNDQLATDNKSTSDEIQHELKKLRCGTCEECLAPDCSKCLSCKKMVKFGGNGKSKQACRLRQCANIDNKGNDNLEDNDRLEELSDDCDLAGNNEEVSLSKEIIHRNVEWIGDCIEENGIKYYKGAKVDDMTVFPGDYVTLHSSSSSAQPLVVIARITNMYNTSAPNPHMFHAHLFTRGSLTVLAECADPRELFLTDTCDECPLGGIVSRVTVERRREGSNWSRRGGMDGLIVSGSCTEDKVGEVDDEKVGKVDDCNKGEDKQSFYYSKKYEAMYGRFVDVSKEEEGNVWGVSCCTSCRNKNIKKSKSTPKILYDHIAWNDVKYRVGSGVYLLPDSFKFELTFPKDTTNKNRRLECSNVDSDLYPEYYRKIPDLTLKGSNFSTPDPFCIGIITEIVDDKIDVVIKVRKLYRPENTHKGIMMTYQKDLNLLYWSEEEVSLPFSKVQGQCYVVYGDSLSIPFRDWTYEGPDRFYFLQSYNAEKKCFEEPPSCATKLGLSRKGNGKGKSLQQPTTNYNNLPVDHPHIPAPLSCLDVFSGCGGLSEGLHQSGVAVTRWAVEKEPHAAEAFRLNNPDCDVFTDDCNHVLRYVMDHEEREDADHGYPRKGDVQLLVGGPPCQGFSGMNRFKAGQYSLFKNSLIVTYLSYCDYYRPAYFVLENVRNFVTFKKSMVLKLTLRCLLAIGYQVSFGIVQGGHYGIPQTRRRLIIMAAAPGYVLPSFPEPLHVFNKQGGQLAVQIGDHKYTNGTRWMTSAPYRTITIRDALSDLPDILNGARATTLPYDSDPRTHFQRTARRSQCPTAPVRDHVCKEMTPLVAARMAHVPLAPGSDWRDLPNVEVGLSDGSRTGRLRYGYRSRRQRGGGVGGARKERNKGVCRCSTGGAPCDPADRQFNTLIPWCLPHTGDRHSNWAGLYGRLEWDGFFSTTVTNPEPMGKQGRILHPDQHRVVSVRECARSQGFPDRYRFSGGLMDKHRQIGNAVPPPLGTALGRMIRLAYHQTINKNILD